VDITRRQFLKALAAATVAAQIPVSAFSATRMPCVNVGEAVDYIGHHPYPGPLGSPIVLEVGSWDGLGYPIVLDICGRYPSAVAKGYDFDFAVLRNEYPPDIWGHPENRAKYPNVQTYIRTRRFGETVEEAIRHLNYTSTEKWLKYGWSF